MSEQTNVTVTETPSIHEVKATRSNGLIFTVVAGSSQHTALSPEQQEALTEAIATAQREATQ